MEDSNRKCTSLKQLELLVQFLENHVDLANCRQRNKEGRAVALRLWSKCAQILNPVGPARTGREWAKFWNDLKARTRGKMRQMNYEEENSSATIKLSPLETRISCIVGSDSDNVKKNPIKHDEKYEAEEIVDASFVDSAPVSSKKKKVRRHSSDDDMPLKRKMEPIDGLEKACKFLNDLQDLDINSLVNDMDEFQYFGFNIAAQLRKLPVERALRLQVDIQNMLANERIQHMSESRNNMNVLPEQNINHGI